MPDLLLAHCAPRHARSASMTLSGCILRSERKSPALDAFDIADLTLAIPGAPMPHALDILAAVALIYGAEGLAGFVGGKKSAPVEMNTTRGELFLASKAKQRLEAHAWPTVFPRGRQLRGRGAPLGAQCHSQPCPNSQQAGPRSAARCWRRVRPQTESNHGSSSSKQGSAHPFRRAEL
jgi:hypothetical protein